MNSNDSEIVASLLESSGFQWVEESESADIVLINTCAIRDNAEQRILGRIAQYKKLKRTSRKNLVIGVLGCMAARVKEELLSPWLPPTSRVTPRGSYGNTRGIYTAFPFRNLRRNRTPSLWRKSRLCLYLHYAGVQLCLYLLRRSIYSWARAEPFGRFYSTRSEKTRRTRL